MTDPPTARHRWFLLRSTGLIPEEEGVLAALAAEAAREGAELVTVLFCTAAYDAEPTSHEQLSASGPVWVLEEDHAGRGIRSREDGNVRAVSADALIEGFMSADKVIPFS